MMIVVARLNAISFLMGRLFKAVRPSDPHATS